MRTTHLSLVTIVAMIMITMTSMAQSSRLDSLGRVYDDIQKRAQVMQLEYDSIYRIIAQCKTDEEIIIHYAEIKKLDKKAQKLGQQTNKVNREIEVEKARMEQQEREAYLSQKQAELLAKNPLPLKGEINGHQWVDMGLPSGTKWATCNVGAKAIHGVGTRIAWGEIATKKLFSPTTYKYNDTLLVSYEGNPKYDLASAQWGEQWCTPTWQQWEELINHCEWDYVMINGINGVLFTSKKTYNTIFLPSTGYTDDESYKLIYTQYNLAYWSSTGSRTNGAYSYIANYEQGYMTTTNRYIAHCVRAVCVSPSNLTPTQK